MRWTAEAWTMSELHGAQLGGHGGVDLVERVAHRLRQVGDGLDLLAELLASHVPRAREVADRAAQVPVSCGVGEAAVELLGGEELLTQPAQEGRGVRHGGE